MLASVFLQRALVVVNYKQNIAGGLRKCTPS